MTYEVSFFIAASNQLRAYARTEETAASLSRVYQHTKERSIGALTAFRNEYSLQENRERNKELEKSIRDAGYGFIKVKGRYIENRGTDREVPVDEESFIIVGGKSDEDKAKLNHFLVDLGKQYEQDSILFKPYDSSEAALVFTSGNEAGSTFNVGEWSPTNLGEYFSVLGKGRSFEFRQKPEPKQETQDQEQQDEQESDPLLAPTKPENDEPNSSDDWWNTLSKKEQERYIEDHPNSKFKDKVKTSD